MYEVSTGDFFQDMWAMKEEFDLASYSKTSPFFDTTNNKVLGKIKEESSEESLREFAGLKPKIYQYQTITDPSHIGAPFSRSQRANWIHRPAVAKLRHEEYNAQLDHPEES